MQQVMPKKITLNERGLFCAYLLFGTKLFKVEFSCFKIQGYGCAYRMYQPIQPFLPLKSLLIRNKIIPRPHRITVICNFEFYLSVRINVGRNH